MGYSDDDSMIRVDFFKQGGKWYTTEAVKWTASWIGKGPEAVHPISGLKKSLRDHFKEKPDRLSEMTAVCLDPYHEMAFPIMIKDGGWNE